MRCGNRSARVPGLARGGRECIPQGCAGGSVLGPATLLQGLDLQSELDRLLAKLSVLGFQSFDQRPIVTPPSRLGIGSPAAPAGWRHFENGSGFLSVR